MIKHGGCFKFSLNNSAVVLNVTWFRSRTRAEHVVDVLDVYHEQVYIQFRCDLPGSWSNQWKWLSVEDELGLNRITCSQCPIHIYVVEILRIACNWLAPAGPNDVRELAISILRLVYWYVFKLERTQKICIETCSIYICEILDKPLPNKAWSWSHQQSHNKLCNLHVLFISGRMYVMLI